MQSRIPGLQGTGCGTSERSAQDEAIVVTLRERAAEGHIIERFCFVGVGFFLLRQRPQVFGLRRSVGSRDVRVYIVQGDGFVRRSVPDRLTVEAELRAEDEAGDLLGFHNRPSLRALM